MIFFFCFSGWLWGYLTCLSTSFSEVPCNCFCFPAPCKCSLIAQRAELCTLMKNYQQALHDADILCRNKPHWPAVRCLPLVKTKMKTASSRGFSLFSWGPCCWGVLLEEYHGINRAKNILSFSKNKSGRSSESLQLVGFWLWAADGVVLFMLVPVICYSLCCSLAAESVHKALTAQDGPAGPSGMLCPQEAVSFDILLANVVLWGATQTVFQDYFPSLLNPKISYLGCLTCVMVFHREVGIFFVTKGCATRSSGQFEASIRNNARREKWKKHLFAWGWTEDPHLGLHLQSLSYH